MQILDVDKKDRKKKKYFTNELRRTKLRSRNFFFFKYTLYKQFTSSFINILKLKKIKCII